MDDFRLDKPLDGTSSGTLFSTPFLKGNSLSNDRDFFLLCEFRVLIKCMASVTYTELSESFRRSDLKYDYSHSHGGGGTPKTKHNPKAAKGGAGASFSAEWATRTVDRKQMAQKWTFLRALHQKLEAWSNQLLATSAPLGGGGWSPRVLRLSNIYGLSPAETELFILLVVLQGNQTMTARLQLTEDDASRRSALCARYDSLDVPNSPKTPPCPLALPCSSGLDDLHFHCYTARMVCPMPTVL